MADRKPDANVPLPVYYARTLRGLQPVLDGEVALSDASAVAALQQGIDDLYLIGRMLSTLGVFSSNEAADELGDRELLFMTSAWVLGEAEARSGAQDGTEARKAAIGRSDNAYAAFIHIVDTYKVIPNDQRGGLGAGGALPADPARRRDAKIAAFTREKELRKEIAQAIPASPPAESTPIAFILALLSTFTKESGATTSVNEDEPDQRAPTLLLLRLLYDQAVTAMGNNAMEMTLLAHAPSEPSQGPLEDPRQKRAEEEDTAWRLDRPEPGNVKPRQLISGGGRVLQPFTILPSTTSMSDRERLRSEVFRSSHRLPTMTIDEYLAEEDQRGNIIRGGGQASADQPTESELLELEAENDGTAAAEEAAEKKRLKDENWANFTDDNRRGAGNTMNRG